MTVDEDHPLWEMMQDACDLMEAGRYVSAIALFRILADLGDTSAQNNLATLLDEVGEHDEAVDWYRRAIRAGDGTAAMNLAVHYRNLDQRRWYVRWLRVALRMGVEDASKLLHVARTQDRTWWAMDHIPPPAFARLQIV